MIAPVQAGAASTILGRIGEDLVAWLGDGSTPTLPVGAILRVEPVVPRTIAGFRARISVPGNDASASPDELRRTAEQLKLAPWVTRCVSVPPRLYLDLDPARMSALVCEELTIERGVGYLADSKLAGRRVSLAFCSPNANKPLHLGHARNMLLGTAIGNLLELAGAHVVRSCCVSDYGVHVSKAVAAYLRHGGGATPQSSGEKGDHLVGRFYALFAADPSLADGPNCPQAITARWMQGDVEVVELTRRLTAWAEAGFDRTFASFGVRFDRRFRETEEHAYIERFIAEQRTRGALRYDESGRLVVDLGTEPPESVPLARSDGSPLYMSHMVAAVLQRLEALGPGVEILLTVTGEEQVVPFVQLGEILERFGYAGGVECRHLVHGLVYADGHGLSSRDGTALTIDGIVDDLAETYGVDVARSALQLYLLSRSIEKPLHYSHESCIETGMRMLLDVATTLEVTRAGPPFTSEHSPRMFGRPADQQRFERFAARLVGYPLAIDRAIRRLDPSLIVHHASSLCRDFVLLLRATEDTGEPPREFTRLFPPTRDVVDHAMRTLGLQSDRLDGLEFHRGHGYARAGSDARPGRRAPARRSPRQPRPR